MQFIPEAALAGRGPVATRRRPRIVGGCWGGGRSRPSPARSGADIQGYGLVHAGTARGVAARVLVPARGLPVRAARAAGLVAGRQRRRTRADDRFDAAGAGRGTAELRDRGGDRALWPRAPRTGRARQGHGIGRGVRDDDERAAVLGTDLGAALDVTRPGPGRSEEHTSALQSLMRISYAVFCLKKNTLIIH